MSAKRTAQASPDEQIKPIRRPVGLAEEVYNAIFKLILSSRIAPGDRVSIEALARDLGVSPTPVREALGRLESEGLIQRTHLVGYRAAPPLSRKQIEDIYDLRLQLEPYIAARAAERATPAQLQELERLAERMAVGGGDPDYGRFAQLDKLFHDLLARAADNAVVEDVVSRTHAHFHIFRLHSTASVTEEALREHGEMLAALRRRDPAAAAQTMRAHIEHSRKRILGEL